LSGTSEPKNEFFGLIEALKFDSIFEEYLYIYSSYMK
jgi:hypothetical protein